MDCSKRCRNIVKWGKVKSHILKVQVCATLERPGLSPSLWMSRVLLAVGPWVVTEFISVCRWVGGQLLGWDECCGYELVGVTIITVVLLLAKGWHCQKQPHPCNPRDSGP